MSQLGKVLDWAQGRNWLSGLALSVIVLAWASSGVWGWVENAAGVMAGLMIALTIGCAVYASRAVKNAVEAEGIVRKLIYVALGVACLGFTGYSGRQGVATSEGQRWAPYDARQQASEAVALIDRKIDALPPVPLSDDAGRPIGPVRTVELGKQRADEVARLAGLRSEAKAALDLLPAVDNPADRMPADGMTALAVLIAALELFGYFTIARPRQRTLPASAPSAVVDIRAAAQAMASKRHHQPA